MTTLLEKRLLEIEIGGALERTELDLSLCQLGDAGALQLQKGLQPSKSLRSLVLKQCGLTAAGFETLGAMLSASSMPLEKLVLSGNLGGPEAIGAEFVQGLKQTATLKSLELASCGISASGVDALCSFLDPAAEAGEARLSILRAKPKLQVAHLDLSDNRLGLEGGRQIQRLLAHNTSLRELNISTNSLGEDGGFEVLEGMRSNRRRLEKLNISYNHIKFEAALAFVRLLLEEEVEFQVSLDLPRQTVGCGVVLDRTCTVTEVVYLSICHIWNEDHPPQAVELGDIVVDVNGKTKTTEMIELLSTARATTLELTLKRRGKGFCELDMCHNAITQEGVLDIRDELGVPDTLGSLQGWLVNIDQPPRKLWLNAS